MQTGRKEKGRGQQAHLGHRDQAEEEGAGRREQIRSPLCREQMLLLTFMSRMSRLFPSLITRTCNQTDAGEPQVSREVEALQTAVTLVGEGTQGDDLEHKLAVGDPVEVALCVAGGGTGIRFVFLQRGSPYQPNDICLAKSNERVICSHLT